MKLFGLEEAKGKKIGTVTAVAIPAEFQFQVGAEVERPLLQDFVVTVHPIYETRPLLAKIVRISRFNPLLPEESALELAKMSIDESLAPLALYGKMEMVAAACQVLGSADESGRLVTPGFPVKPGSSVYLPSKDYLLAVLGGGNPTNKIILGNLRNRTDVPAIVDGNEFLNKHLAILAMTGSGKTYAASVILEELMKKGYPLLIIDPHADYLNLGQRLDKKDFVFEFGPSRRGKYELSIFDNSIALTELGLVEFIQLVESVAGEEVMPAQRGIYSQAFEHVHEDEKKEPEKMGLKGIYGYVNTLTHTKTTSVVYRQLNMVKNMMAGVEANLTFDKVVSAIGPGRGVILNMSSLPAPIQRINVQIILEKLFAMRKETVTSSAKTIHFPPVFVVVEEAHNFAPAQEENETYPSKRVLRRVATEGRKFGFGLCVISQRPSRLDPTVLSQCNSQLILRIVNPNDQTYIRNTVESLAESDLYALPELSQGEALISGAMVTIPSLIKVRQRESLEGIPAVNRFDEISKWS